MKTLTFVLITGIALYLVAGVYPCFAYGEDKSDRLSRESSYAFSPGYVNAAKYQAENLLRVNLPEDKKKGILGSAMDFVKNMIVRNTKDRVPAQQFTKPKLQKKAGSINPGTVQTAPANIMSALDLTEGDIPVGTGTDQRDKDGRLLSDPDSDGRMVSEVIDGTRYIYVGFDNFGVNMADGYESNIFDEGCSYIFKGGTYTINVPLRLHQGSNIYGGYYEDGTRSTDMNTNATIINGQIDVRSNFLGGCRDGASTIEGLTINGWIEVGTELVVNIRYNNITSPGAGIGINSQGLYGDGMITLEHNNITGTTGVGIIGIISPIPGMPELTIGNYETITSADNNFYALTGFSFTGESGVTSTNDYYAGDYSSGGGDFTVVDPSPGPNSAGDAGLPGSEATSDLMFNNPYAYDFQYDASLGRSVFAFGAKENAGYEYAGVLFKHLLTLNDTAGGFAGLEFRLNKDAIAKIAAQMFAEGARHINYAELASALAAILSDPTEDQKAVIDEVTKLLQDMDNLKAGSGENPELKKTTDELLQAVASVLLAQAIPDLFREGDIASIKSIFGELASAKTKVILEYNEATKPYYEEIKKMIEKNAEALQLSNILQKNLTQKELEEMPRSEIDKIIERLKSKSRLTTEEQYILQQESKYGKIYVEPNKQKLEEKMKNMIQGFTKRLSATLGPAKK